MKRTEEEARGPFHIAKGKEQDSMRLFFESIVERSVRMQSRPEEMINIHKA